MYKYMYEYLFRFNLLFYLFFTVVNTTFSTGLAGVEVSSVSWLGQFTVGVVLLTTKGLQEKSTQMFDGTTVEK